MSKVLRAYPVVKNYVLLIMFLSDERTERRKCSRSRRTLDQVSPWDQYQLRRHLERPPTHVCTIILADVDTWKKKSLGGKQGGQSKNNNSGEESKEFVMAACLTTMKLGNMTPRGVAWPRRNRYSRTEVFRLTSTQPSVETQMIQIRDPVACGRIPSLDTIERPQTASHVLRAELPLWQRRRPKHQPPERDENFDFRFLNS
jgi:hypothetical protein